MDHHTLDIYPNPREKAPLYINEPWIIDETMERQTTEPSDAADNIRIYVPIDLNHDAILRKLRNVISKYGDVDWRNESNIMVDVGLLVYQLEIYDQVHFVRHPAGVLKQPGEEKHSTEATTLVRDFIRELEKINSTGDTFPYDVIEKLKKEYDL